MEKKETKRMKELLKEGEMFIKENLPIGFSDIANMDTEDFLLFKKAMHLYGEMKDYLVTVDEEYLNMQKELNEIKEQNKELLSIVKDLQGSMRAMSKK